MHRSGTSAFTRVLSLLGCDLPKTPMPANQSNETGYWESGAIYQLNDKILASAGTKWNDWLEVSPGWLQSPKAGEFREQALALLQEEFGSSRLFVLKDPRICRLAPFWLAVLEEAGVQPLVVSPVRNPLEVAASLGRRDGFEAGLGHLLWLRHVLDAEFASRGLPRFFTSYDRLMSGWARTATDAQAALGIAWPRMTDKVAVDIEAFLSNAYRHHQQPVEAVLDNPTLSDWLRTSFEILGRWGVAGEDRQDFAELDRIRAALNSAAPAFSRLLIAEQAKIEGLESKLGSAVSEAESRADAAKAAEQALARALFNVATAEKTAAAEQEKNSRLESELQTARQRVGESEQQTSRLKGDLETQTHAAKAAATALEEVRHQLAQTESALAQRRHEAEETAGELVATREELRRTIAAHAEAEKVASGLKEHLVLMIADVKERQAALAGEVTTGEAVAGLTRQIKQVLAILDTSRDQLATRLAQAQQTCASQSTAMQKQAGEIEALRRLLEQSRSEAERLRQVNAGQIRSAVAGMLNGHGSPLEWKPLRLRRQAALLRRSGLFDADWYLHHNADVAKAGIDPLRHFIEYGAREGRAPNPAALAHANGKADPQALNGSPPHPPAHSDGAKT